MQWKAASRLQVIDLLSLWETPCQEDKESLLDTLEASILKGLDVLAEKNPRSTPVVVIDDLSSLWHASVVGLSQWLSWLERIHDIIRVDVNISYFGQSLHSHYRLKKKRGILIVLCHSDTGLQDETSQERFWLQHERHAADMEVRVSGLPSGTIEGVHGQVRDCAFC